MHNTQPIPQPLKQISEKQLPPELAELSEESLWKLHGDADSASVLPPPTACCRCRCRCSYDGDNAE
ncbi:DUF5837 family cyanobactin class RiPP [Nostoc sp. C117]|uniref:DUF5837 family cyanobactin class RiPP n=1 Tax=Nostoc sp. C117 TaxID=3349875 RepID=UPI00370DC2CD